MGASRPSTFKYSDPVIPSGGEGFPTTEKVIIYDISCRYCTKLSDLSSPSFFRIRLRAVSSALTDC